MREIDITNFFPWEWIREESKLMLKEELERAITHSNPKNFPGEKS